MSIESYTILSTSAQPDGSTHVHEQHMDHLGKIYDRVYTAAPGADLAANASAWSARLETSLAEQEAEALLNG